jgi:hypothetical protein
MPICEEKHTLSTLAKLARVSIEKYFVSNVILHLRVNIHNIQAQCTESLGVNIKHKVHFGHHYD